MFSLCHTFAGVHLEDKMRPHAQQHLGMLTLKNVKTCWQVLQYWYGNGGDENLSGGDQERQSSGDTIRVASSSLSDGFYEARKG